MSTLLSAARTDTQWPRLALRALRIATVVGAAVVSLAVLAKALSARLEARAEPTHSTLSAIDVPIRVPILVYHSIAPHHPGQTAEQRELDVDTLVFQKQMQFLVDHGYRAIPFATLVAALEGTATVPDRGVVITFDDGWATQYHFAFPTLRRLGLTATFFVYTNGIARDHVFMSWDEVRELRDAGMTIGSHSRSHPLLTDANVSLTDEVEGSRELITRNLGTAPDFFAYPYGEWNQRVAAAVKAAGYRAARAYPGGVVNSRSDLFALHSVLTTDDMVAFERLLGSP